MAKTTKFYGTGRRKSSIARVYIAPGTGKITINKKDMDEYFGLDTLKVIVKQPLVATGTDGKFDVMVNVKGGGFTGQAGAIRDNSTEYRKRATNPENPVFSGFSLYSENLSNILKTHENLSITNTQLTGN